MSHAPDLSMPHAGDILGGRYVLAERIGAGGMGRVFRARDEVLRRDVAIKIFHSDRTDEPEALRRMAEARALAALDHPSLVTLFDARLDDDDHVYLVMELIDGPSLQRRIEHGPLSSVEVAGILSDLAGALAIVHNAGIVHRDVKPSNVLLRPLRGAGRACEAVLADFGVAHLIDATRLTTPGTVIGTAAYLAPEQVRGEPPQAASDVYSLGLLGIEALTRLHPFGGGSLQETLLARLARQPEVPTTLGYAWRSLLVAMTAPDPASRPTAADVAERAEALARGGESLLAETGPLSTVADTPWAALGLDTGSGDIAATPTLALDRTAATGGGTAAVAATVAAAAPLPDTAALAEARDTTSSSATREDTATAVASSATAPRAFADPARRRAPSRRRRLVWAGATLAGAVIIGGHIAAFSLGAAGGPTTGDAPEPTPSITLDAPTPVASTAPEETDVVPVSTIDDAATDGSTSDGSTGGGAPAAPVESPVVQPAPAAPADLPATDPGKGTGGGGAGNAGGGAGGGGAANGADDRGPGNSNSGGKGNGGGNGNGKGNAKGAGDGNGSGKK